MSAEYLINGRVGDSPGSLSQRRTPARRASPGHAGRGHGVTTRYTTPLEQRPGEAPVSAKNPLWLVQLGRLPAWIFVLGYAVAAAGCGALALTGGGHLVDLHVYLTGGQAVFHGSRLYQVHYAQLPFTYP